MIRKICLILLFILPAFIQLKAQDIYGTAKSKDTLYLNPNDFNVGQVLAIDTINGTKVVVGKDSITGSTFNRTYFRIRARFYQENGVSSGKVRLVSTDEVGTPDITIADEYWLPSSSRVDTGIYKMQFRVGGINKFIREITEIAGTNGLFTFERIVYPVFGHYVYNSETEEDEWIDELVGYCVFPTNTYQVGDFDFNAGALMMKTYDANWVLKDNILKDGYTFELKCFSRK